MKRKSLIALGIASFVSLSPLLPCDGEVLAASTSKTKTTPTSKTPSKPAPTPAKPSPIDTAKKLIEEKMKDLEKQTATLARYLSVKTNPKWEYPPAATIQTAKKRVSEIEDLLKKNPSLKSSYTSRLTKAKDTILSADEVNKLLALSYDTVKAYNNLVAALEDTGFSSDTLPALNAYQSKVDVLNKRISQKDRYIYMLGVDAFKSKFLAGSQIIQMYGPAIKIGAALEVLEEMLYDDTISLTKKRDAIRKVTDELERYMKINPEVAQELQAYFDELVGNVYFLDYGQYEFSYDTQMQVMLESATLKGDGSASVTFVEYNDTYTAKLQGTIRIIYQDGTSKELSLGGKTVLAGDERSTTVTIDNYENVHSIEYGVKFEKGARFTYAVPRWELLVEEPSDEPTDGSAGDGEGSDETDSSDLFDDIFQEE
jgi:hypothetical protein